MNGMSEQQISDFNAFGACVIPPRTEVSCPIDLCLWTYTIPRLDPRINADTLAGVFGPGIMAQHAINQQNQTTERAIEEHMKSHTLVDWIGCIQRLKLNIAARDARIAELERGTT